MTTNVASAPFSDTEDLDLVRRVLAGDRKTFEVLVRRHERRVYRVALAILGNSEDAEEAMQDAFVRAFRHLGQFRHESQFSTWLTRIAVNEAMRKRSARKDTLPLAQSQDDAEPFIPRRFEAWEENPEKLYGRRELRAIIEGAIRSLPAAYREVFVLRDVEGMSAEEAAGALGITIPALKSRLLRARLMVRDSLSRKFEKTPALSAKFIHKAVGSGATAALRVMRIMMRQARP